MIRRRALLFALACAATLASGCARKPPEGFRPPLTNDPLQFHIDNWRKIHMVSGFYDLTFQYSDGERVGLKADVAVEPGVRSVVNLVSSRGAEAVVTITPEFINLLNHHDRYFIREPSTAETADRIVGLNLPSSEAASLLCGQGFDSERMEHIYTDAEEDGGVSLHLFHAEEDLRAVARIDAFGRLRTIAYFNAITDEELIRVEYLDFRWEGSTGALWPGMINISLPERNERIELRATDIDINNQDVINRSNTVFAKLERGSRLHLEDIPAGPPLIYRDLRIYINKEER